jgi:hypothetical protein
LDEESIRETPITRLSPHVKPIKERIKYGYSFYPGTDILLEPWTANAVLPKKEMYWLEPQFLLVKKNRESIAATPYAKRIESISKKLEFYLQFNRAIAGGMTANREKKLQLIKDNLDLFKEKRLIAAKVTLLVSKKRLAPDQILLITTEIMNRVKILT